MDKQEHISSRRKQVLKEALPQQLSVVIFKYLGEEGDKEDPKEVNEHHLLGHKGGSLLWIAFEEKDNCREDNRQNYSANDRTPNVKTNFI